MVANDIENIFFNAAQGSRNPDHSCIAYLKTDNSFEMEGSKNGLKDGEHQQTRYKYSPATRTYHSSSKERKSNVIE